MIELVITACIMGQCAELHFATRFHTSVECTTQVPAIAASISHDLPMWAVKSIKCVDHAKGEDT